jgi:hypothetical protein
MTNDTWLWSGVSPGTPLPGFANGETDWMHPDTVAPVPPGTAVLTTTPLDFCSTSDPKQMDIVGYVAPSGARVLGGATFAWGCSLVANCPANWEVLAAPENAAAVGQAVRNLLAWVDDGLVVPGGMSGSTALRNGSLRSFAPQRIGKLRPDSGLPSLVIAQDLD